MSAWSPWTFGTKVRTVRSRTESKDWTPDALKQRRWDVCGDILRHSDSHGLCYLVKHEDGTEGWYERRELVLL